MRPADNDRALYFSAVFTPLVQFNLPSHHTPNPRTRGRASSMTLLESQRFAKDSRNFQKADLPIRPTKTDELDWNARNRPLLTQYAVVSALFRCRQVAFHARIGALRWNSAAIDEPRSSGSVNKRVPGRAASWVCVELCAGTSRTRSCSNSVNPRCRGIRIWGRGS